MKTPHQRGSYAAEVITNSVAVQLKGYDSEADATEYMAAFLAYMGGAMAGVVGHRKAAKIMHAVADVVALQDNSEETQT